eukprot:TRINITY_DN110853_c0_g1_i1.p1 TRINITY_DN110853_c0_g1~~TRINITY_DN110853_c0_g1_i1.p1  ORF type:complete len:732 (+),score=126.78 TRINITY_DN110853_c0_g1_i1:135-2330(+)
MSNGLSNGLSNGVTETPRGQKAEGGAKQCEYGVILEATPEYRSAVPVGTPPLNGHSASDGDVPGLGKVRKGSALAAPSPRSPPKSPPGERELHNLSRSSAEGVKLTITTRTARPVSALEQRVPLDLRPNGIASPVGTSSPRGLADFDPALMLSELDLGTFRNMLDFHFMRLSTGLQDTIKQTIMDMDDCLDLSPRTPTAPSIWRDHPHSDSNKASAGATASQQGKGCSQRANSPTRSVGFSLKDSQGKASESPLRVEPTILKDDHNDDGLQLCRTNSKNESEKKSNAPARSIWDYVDTDNIKKTIRSEILKGDAAQDVKAYYHDSGFFARIARTSTFEKLTLVAIVLNALWIAVDADMNDATSMYDAEPVFWVVANLFCFYFTFELLIRFLAFKDKTDIRKDSWFMFDGFLVVVLILETWVDIASRLSQFEDAVLLRLLRLARLSRIIRMLRSLPELNALVKGMVAALRSVLYVMVLLALITYAFAVAFSQLSEGFEFRARFFDGVPHSMYTLIVYCIFLDNLAEVTEAVRHESIFILFVLFLFVTLACMTVMNMLVGVLCEVISAVAATEKEEIRTRCVTEQMCRLVTELGISTDSGFSLKEFMTIMTKHEAVLALKTAGVDPVALIDMAPLFFYEGGRQVDMPFEQFMELVLDLRGTNKATVKDVMNLGRQLSSRFEDQRSSLSTSIKVLSERHHKLDDRLTEISQLLQQPMPGRSRMRLSSSNRMVLG